MKWTTSEKGIEFICREEGFRSDPYLCPAGVPTIGFGSTRYADGTVVSLADMPITKAEALELKAATMPFYEEAVNRYVQVELNQDAFDALASFTYNLGPAALRGSTLLRLLNAGNIAGAGREFGKWVRAGGRVLPGLVKRRARERELFETLLQPKGEMR